MIIKEKNAKFLCGWKGREEINDCVSAILVSKSHLQKFANDQNIFRDPDNAKYSMHQIAHHLHQLKNIREIYLRAYPKKGIKLFDKLKDRAKLYHLQIEAKHMERDYYATQYQKSFNEGNASEHWIDKIQKIDKEIDLLECKR